MQDLCLFRHFVKCRRIVSSYEHTHYQNLSMKKYFTILLIMIIKYLWHNKKNIVLPYLYVLVSRFERAKHWFFSKNLQSRYIFFILFLIHNSCLLVYTWSSLSSPCCGQAWPFYSARGSSPAPPTYSHHLLEFLSCYCARRKLMHKINKFIFMRVNCQLAKWRKCWTTNYSNMVWIVYYGGSILIVRYFHFHCSILMNR